MTWHIPHESLARYARGALDDARSFSVEAHLLGCAECRARTASFADRARIEELWGRVDEATAGPEPGPIERLLLASGVPDHAARLLAATSSLSLSWLVAITSALTFAVAAAHAAQSLMLFLIVAPLLPVAGIAAAYGPGVDPTYEVGLAAPLSSFELLLVRARAVLATTLVLTALAAFGLPGVGWTAAAWLLPSLALVTTSLALSTLFSPARAAAGVALAWVTVTSLSAWQEHSSSVAENVFGAPMQVALLGLVLASLALLAARRDAFERGDRP
jgi:hypothetical protein